MVYPEVVELATERAMNYLRTRLSGEELGRYEGYYMVFRDYRADEGIRYYKWFLIIQRFIAEAWRELSERFLEVFRYPVDRVLNITPTPDGVVIVQNECDDRLRTWMIPSIATLRWLIHEATAGETPPRIYHLPPLNSIVLEREQIERFHIVARTYEIKTQNKEVV
ncbi:MAG: hypothetical protein RQ862_11045 [Candidatus Caldarchaeales archaeon]|jgi:hypothetical protein|nr:hypothetical protein [Candidatus Caldarchaeales archaeon]